MKRKMLSQGRCLAAVAAVLVLGGCAATGTPKPQTQVSETASLPELMRLAERSREAGNASVAADIYEKAAKKYPDAAEPFIGLGHAARSAGQPRRATTAFREALKRNPESLAARYGLGQSLLDGDRLSAAIEQFNVLIDAGTKDHRPYLSKGVALDLLDRHNEAQAAYRAGLEHAPESVALKNNLGLSLALSKDYRKAMRTLEAVVRDPTAPARARQNLALVYGMAGDMQRAAATAGEDLSPQTVERNLAYYRALQGLRGENGQDAGKTGVEPGARTSELGGIDAAKMPDDADQPLPPDGKPIQLAAAVAMPSQEPDPAKENAAKTAGKDEDTAEMTPASVSDADTVADEKTSAMADMAEAGAASEDEASDASAKREPESEPANPAQVARLGEPSENGEVRETGNADAEAQVLEHPNKPSTVNEESRTPGATTAEAVRKQLSETPRQDSGDGKPAYWAQFASFSSPESGKAEWQRLQERYPELVAGLPLSLQSAELPEKGTFYRVRTGPFDAKQAPDRLCDALAEKGQGCLVVQR
jgi:Flp pilus assembly protein TadD